MATARALGDAPATPNEIPPVSAPPHVRVAPPPADLDVRFGPGSLLWEYIGDVRVLLVLGHALLIQTAHPVIGAGVNDHSVFREDPWGRLERSLMPIVDLVYNEDPVAVGTWIRNRHVTIKGTRPDGVAYHSLHPEAYWLVLATGFDALVQQRAKYGRPLSTAEIAGAYREFRGLWLLVGMRAEQVPETVEEFWRVYHRLLDERLLRTTTVDDVFTTIRNVPPPPELAKLPGAGALWPLARPLVSRVLLNQMRWQMRPADRERLGVSWSAKDEAAARSIATAVRTVFRVVPRPLRWVRPARQGHRREGTLLRASGSGG